MKKSKPMNYKNVLFYTAQLQHLINTQMGANAKKQFISLENIKRQILSFPDHEKPGVFYYSILSIPSQGEFNIGCCAVDPQGAIEVINRIFSDNPVLIESNKEELENSNITLE